MKLIDEWRAAWRMLTIHIAAIAVAFGLLPADQQQSILESIGVPSTRIPALIGALIIVARLVKQPKVSGDEAQ